MTGITHSGYNIRMKFLTSQQAEVYRKLVVIAKGNELLVYNALKHAGSGDRVGSLKEAIEYIKRHT